MIQSIGYSFVEERLSLQPILKDIYRLTLPEPDAQTGIYRLYADGYVGLTFNEADTDVLFNKRNSGSLFLYGQTVKPLEIEYRSSTSIIVICLQPYAINYLFGIDTSGLTDTCLDFDCIDYKLKRELRLSDSADERIGMILKYLLQHEKSPRKIPDRRINQAVNRIQHVSGNLSLSSLHKELLITERTFERQFLKAVGITPATFSKICRFNAAMKQLNNPSNTTLTDVAYHSGYADQSHFIRHFKEFTSITPSEYLARLKNRQ